MGSAGYVVNAVAVVLIIFFNIMFMFRMSPSPFPNHLIPHHIHTHPLLTKTHSLRQPPHNLNNELQQRNPSRRPLPHNNMVVHPRTNKLSRSKTSKPLRRREDCRDAQGWACGVSFILLEGMVGEWGLD